VVDVIPGAMSENELRGKINDLLGVPA
jgi:hypothetical protein